MSQHYNNEFSAPPDLFAAAAAADERGRFITRTYSYLVGAVALLVGIEFILFQTLPVNQIARLMMGSGVSWMIVLGLFMGVSFLANTWATSPTSQTVQRLGLGLYVLAESFILLPLLAIALSRPDGATLIQSAALSTLGLFALMTLAVFITRFNFSFLGTFLYFAGFAILGLFVVCVFTGFQLPVFLIYGLIAFACAWILYHTSNVLHEYRVDQHVAAALALFGSLALLFWYVMQLFLARDE